MQPFKSFTGIVAPMDRPNVDTDQIIPKQFLKAVVRSGLGHGLFFDWRLLPGDKENPEFVLNQPRYRKATILVARANFGSGSSREHAVWAFQDFGFKAVIAPSFGDIFRINSMKNGFLPLITAPVEVEAIFAAVMKHAEYKLSVDLANQRISDELGWSAYFDIDAHSKKCVMEGLDDVALTLAHESEIQAYEKTHPVPYPGV